MHFRVSDVLRYDDRPRGRESGVQVDGHVDEHLRWTQHEEQLVHNRHGGHHILVMLDSTKHDVMDCHL